MICLSVGGGGGDRAEKNIISIRKLSKKAAKSWLLCLFKISLFSPRDIEGRGYRQFFSMLEMQSFDKKRVDTKSKKITTGEKWGERDRWS